MIRLTAALLLIVTAALLAAATPREVAEVSSWLLLLGWFVAGSLWVLVREDVE